MTNLIWNDPDPIEGIDYNIVSFQQINDEMALIVYNQGKSEAEVFLHEVVTPWELPQDP
jgi:hypothetical protein